MPAGVLLVTLGLTLGPCTLPQPEPALWVTVTAYASGTRTASGRRPRPGMLAVSRDLERALHLHFGDRITLENFGTFIFEDRMPRQWSRRVDVYMSSKRKALQFGKRRAGLWVDIPGPGCR
jgi:3D (Asp-Asp-Asp) domain-containing protein